MACRAIAVLSAVNQPRGMSVSLSAIRCWVSLTSAKPMRYPVLATSVSTIQPSTVAPVRAPSQGTAFDGVVLNRAASSGTSRSALAARRITDTTDSTV
jgi:hypothetical protein